MLKKQGTTDAAGAQDQSVTVMPALPWKVRAVSALPGWRLSLIFADGTAGETGLAALIKAGGVFSALADPATFDGVTLENGAPAWPALGLDLAPDALYRAVRDGIPPLPAPPAWAA